MIRAGFVLPLAAMTVAMASFQIGAAMAKGLFPAVGPLGAAALRLGLGALLLLALTQPWRRWPTKPRLWPVVVLGLSMACAIVMFYSAVQRLPLAVAIALQFLGPLGVAIAGSRRATDLVWAGLAAAGVWFLTVAGRAGLTVDLAGVGFALAAAVGWAAYILLGRAASADFGRSAAALAVSVAAVVAIPAGAAHAGSALLAPSLLPLALAVAFLSTAFPFSLELYALGRLPSRTFAIFTCLEPAFAVLSGFVMLHERLSGPQLAGVAAVIAAAAGAAWSSRAPQPTDAAPVA